MAKLEFGMDASVGNLLVDDIAGFARRCEELGFDYFTAGEHVMFHGPVANTFIGLAVAAGATKRIKLLSLVTLVPLYPAALLGKMTAMLDFASGGRFHLGVGIGGEFPREFEACGVPVRERGRRTDEALEVIRRLLCERNVSFQGKFNQFTDFTIDPPPIQKPWPPIWVGGRKEPAMRRAARYGDGWIPYMYTPEQMQRSIETIRGFGQEYGRDLRGLRTGIVTHITIYDDAAKAKHIAGDLVGKYYGQDVTRIVDRYLVAGAPEQCRQRLREYSDAGAQVAFLTLTCPPEDTEPMLRRVAEEIIPEFR